MKKGGWGNEYGTIRCDGWVRAGRNRVIKPEFLISEKDFFFFSET
jgi:hypothetical protein